MILQYYSIILYDITVLLYYMIIFYYVIQYYSIILYDLLFSSLLFYAVACEDSVKRVQNVWTCVKICEHV